MTSPRNLKILYTSFNSFWSIFTFPNLPKLFHHYSSIILLLIFLYVFNKISQKCFIAMQNLSWFYRGIKMLVHADIILESEWNIPEWIRTPRREESFLLLRVYAFYVYIFTITGWKENLIEDCPMQEWIILSLSFSFSLESKHTEQFVLNKRFL